MPRIKRGILLPEGLLLNLHSHLEPHGKALVNIALPVELRMPEHKGDTMRNKHQGFKWQSPHFISVESRDCWEF